MSENTSAMLSGGSPEVRACHIPGYSLMALSELLADSNNNWLTDGSVTMSSPP